MNNEMNYKKVKELSFRPNDAPEVSADIEATLSNHEDKMDSEIMMELINAISVKLLLLSEIKMGEFIVIGNPLNTMFIPDVKWDMDRVKKRVEPVIDEVGNITNFNEYNDAMFDETRFVGECRGFYDYIIESNSYVKEGKMFILYHPKVKQLETFNTGSDESIEVNIKLNKEYYIAVINI